MTALHAIVKQSLFLVLLTVMLPSLASAETGLQTFDGKGKNIEDYASKDKWLIVMIWASDCHICNKEAQQYVTFHNNHQHKNAQMLGISSDGASKKKQAEAFISRHKLNYPNLIAEPGVVAELYTELTGESWYGTPTFLVFAPSGELKAAQIGAVPTSSIEKFIQKNS